MRPHSMVAAGTLIRDQLVTCADPIIAKQCLAKCLATCLAMFGNDKVFTDTNHPTSIVGKSDFVSGILILESIFPNFSEYFS